MSSAPSSTSSPGAAGVHKGFLLALLAGSQFVVVLDASITNVALPSIGRDLGLSRHIPDGPNPFTLESRPVTAYVAPSTDGRQSVVGLWDGGGLTYEVRLDLHDPALVWRIAERVEFLQGRYHY